MPPAPELRDATAEVGRVEVAHQPDPEQLRRPDGNVAVAREVAVNLEREQQRRQQQRAPRMVRVAREHLVHIHRAVVGHHHLLEQPPQDLPNAVDGPVVVELPPPQELG